MMKLLLLQCVITIRDRAYITCLFWTFLAPTTTPVYSAHWIQRLATVTGVEVAIDSAVAIYVMQELQVPLGLRSLQPARPLYPRSLYPMGTVLLKQIVLTYLPSESFQMPFSQPKIMGQYSVVMIKLYGQWSRTL